MATPQSLQRWFVTAQISRVQWRRGVAERVPATPVHVKQLGTRRTACGLSTDSWITFWERRTSELAPGACGRCAAVVGRQVPR